MSDNELKLPDDTDPVTRARAEQANLALTAIEQAIEGLVDGETILGITGVVVVKCKDGAIVSSAFTDTTPSWIQYLRSTAAAIFTGRMGPPTVTGLSHKDTKARH